MSFLFPLSSRASATLKSATTETASKLCPRCQQRSLASSAFLYSGHNRWSKIRHEKGAADRKKHTQRSTFAKHLTLYSKLYGPDPSLNPQLATVIATAKKTGMPKAGIDIAIARGQGKTSTGEGLESATLEVMVGPSSVAVVVDIETDNKQRSLMGLRAIVKAHQGTVTPTAFLFARKGRTVLKGKEGTDDDFDDVLMAALDADAEDVEQDDESNIVLWTQPNLTHQVAQALSKSLSTEILSSDIIWSPTSDRVKLDDPIATKCLGVFLAALQDHPDVQAVYANAERGAVSEDVWSTVENNIDA